MFFDIREIEEKGGLWKAEGTILHLTWLVGSIVVRDGNVLLGRYFFISALLKSFLFLVGTCRSNVFPWAYNTVESAAKEMAGYDLRPCSSSVHYDLHSIICI